MIIFTPHFSLQLSYDSPLQTCHFHTKRSILHPLDVNLEIVNVKTLKNGGTFPPKIGKVETTTFALTNKNIIE